MYSTAGHIKHLTNRITPIGQELGCFLDGVLASVRWVALGALLLAVKERES